MKNCIFLFLLFSTPTFSQLFWPDWISNSTIDIDDSFNTCPEDSYVLVFEDNFNGTTINNSKWYTHYPYGVDNSDNYYFCRTHDDLIGEPLSQQIYLDENLEVSNGKFTIEIKRENAAWFN